MRLNRRQLLALLAAPPALAALATVGVGVHWWDQPPGATMRHLSPDEAEFIRAFAGAAWPATEACALDGAQADLDHLFDESLSGLELRARQAARLGLHALDQVPLVSHGHTFHGLDPAARGQVLASWLDSDLMPLRAAVTGVVVLVGMGYTTHPRTEAVFSGLYRCWYGR